MFIRHFGEDGEGRGAPFLVLAALFAAISTLAAVDIISDLDEGASSGHLLVEGGLLIAGFIGLVQMLRGLLGLRQRAATLEARTQQLHQRLGASQAEAARWRSEAEDLLRGLSEAIDRQFARWELSEAEKDVAYLLLKGLSHKEIAAIRQTNDVTTRQQARGIYKEGGLAGRHDLAAFFLEDLLQPPSR